MPWCVHPIQDQTQTLVSQAWFRDMLTRFLTLVSSTSKDSRSDSFSFVTLGARDSIKASGRTMMIDGTMLILRKSNVLASIGTLKTVSSSYRSTHFGMSSESVLLLKSTTMPPTFISLTRIPMVKAATSSLRSNNKGLTPFKSIRPLKDHLKIVVKMRIVIQEPMLKLVFIMKEISNHWKVLVTAGAQPRRSTA